MIRALLLMYRFTANATSFNGVGNKMYIKFNYFTTCFQDNFPIILLQPLFVTCFLNNFYYKNLSLQLQGEMGSFYSTFPSFYVCFINENHRKQPTSHKITHFSSIYPGVRGVKHPQKNICGRNGFYIRLKHTFTFSAN